MADNTADTISPQIVDANLDDDDLSEAEFTLAKVIVTTRALGRGFGHGWGAQALALVGEQSIFACPRCDQFLTNVSIGNLNFTAEIERPFCGQFIANLIAWHRVEDCIARLENLRLRREREQPGASTLESGE
jgi:hypothetical protein